MFNARAYENARPDGFGVLEIPSTPDDARNSPPRFVPLRRTTLTGEVAGPLASLRLTQVFGYTREQCPDVLEAVYRFPLPGDAAVTGVCVRFGAVEVRAELKERQRAETDYAEAKRQGKQAALLTRESPDVFTLQVAGITPDQDVTVETDYVQLARAEGAGWSLRVPLTTSPRFVRSDEVDSRHAQGQPLCLLRDPGHRFALDVTLADTGIVQSPTHSLDVLEEGSRVRVRLRDSEVVPDRDCVLRWEPPREVDRPRLHVLVHEDAASGQVYFLAQVAPPKHRPAGAGVPRETVVLVDHSGSMQGAKWAAADWAVKKFLSELSERDAFSLGLFHDRTCWHGKAMQPGSAAAVGTAIEFLEEHRDSGGTQLGVALEQALERPRVKGDASRHVLVITDAEVSDAGRILRLADEEAKRPDRRRIDVLCIDAAPNSFLATELAERGGGVSRFLTSDPEQGDITTALDEVLADWSQPLFAGLRLEVDRGAVQATGRSVLPVGPRRAIDLGDLPAGRSIWVAGRAPRGSDRTMSFRLLTPEGREVAVCHVGLDGQATRPGVKALFGARRVLGLEYLIHSGLSGHALQEQLTRLGYDSSDLRPGKGKVYAENIRQEATTALRQLLVREALDYGLGSAETAFVAVRRENGQPVQGTVFVANALPQGWSDQFAGGGTPMLLGAVFGSVASAAPPPAASAGTSWGLAQSITGDSSVRARVASAAAQPQASKSGGSHRLMGGSGLIRQSGCVLFDGVPALVNDEAVLYDSAGGSLFGKVPESCILIGLRVKCPSLADGVAALDPELCVLLFVDDPVAPRVKVRLTDLLRYGGERPLNVRRASGQRLRLVLADPSGTWAKDAPAVQVCLNWA